MKRLAWIIRAGLFATLCVVVLQPLFYGAITNVDRLISPGRTWQHIADAFAVGALTTIDRKKANVLLSGGDLYTECIGVGVGLEPDKSRIETGLMESYPGDGTDPCGALLAASANPAAVPWIQYVRYWHGYRLYSAPVISALPFAALRILSFVVLAAATFLFYRECARLIGPIAAFALTAPVILLTDLLKMYRVTPDVVSVGVILLSIAIFARALRASQSAFVLIAIAAVAGSIFCFVDLLRNPPWTPMMLAFLVLAGPRDKPVTDAIWVATVAVLAWFGGYALTWFSKWFVVYLTIPDFDIVSDVLNQTKLRALGEERDVLHVPLYSSLKVFAIALASWFLPVLIWLIAGFIRFAGPIKFDRPRLWLLMSPVLVSALWFEIVSNHSQTHAGGVARSAAAAIGVALAALIIASGKDQLRLNAFLRSLIRAPGRKPLSSG